MLKASPRVHSELSELVSIPGSPSSLKNTPSGCRFHPRCKLAVDACKGERPALREVAPGHWSACPVVK